jgi:hypothetical protein
VDQQGCFPLGDEVDEPVSHAVAKVQPRDLREQHPQVSPGRFGKGAFERTDELAEPLDPARISSAIGTLGHGQADEACDAADDALESRG